MRAVRVVNLALAAALIPAGCGGDSEGRKDERRPRVAIEVRHQDGSVPPPFHAEWTLNVDEEGRGRIVYVPDYAKEGVPRYRARFTADRKELDQLIDDMEERGLLEGTIEMDDNAPAGGDYDAADLTVNGSRVDVPAFGPGGDPPLGSLMDEIEALVPRPVWQRLLKRREAYAKKRYGQAP